MENHEAFNALLDIIRHQSKRIDELETVLEGLAEETNASIQEIRLVLEIEESKHNHQSMLSAATMRGYYAICSKNDNNIQELRLALERLKTKHK